MLQFYILVALLAIAMILLGMWMTRDDNSATKNEDDRQK
jgi:hypothetical protein